MARMPTQPLQRGLQVAFGIDQEVRGDDHRFPIGKSRQHLDAVTGPATQPDLARREPARCALHQHHLAGAGVEHG